MKMLLEHGAEREGRDSARNIPLHHCTRYTKCTNCGVDVEALQGVEAIEAFVIVSIDSHVGGSRLLATLREAAIQW